MTQHPEKFIHSEQPGESNVAMKPQFGKRVTREVILFSFFFLQIILQNWSIHVTVGTTGGRLRLCQSFPENRRSASVLAFCNSWLQLAWTSIACVATLRAALVDKELAGKLLGHTVLWSGGKQTDKPVCTQMLLRSVANQNAENNAESGFCFVAKFCNFISKNKAAEWEQHATFNSGEELLQVCPWI